MKSRNKNCNIISDVLLTLYAKGVYILNNKVVYAIISLLVVSSIAVSVYTFTRFNNSCSNLEQYEDLKIYVEEEPKINDVKDEEVKLEFELYDAPYTSGFKSYMDYRKITTVTSPQYILQNEYAYTGNYGIRMVNDRYCIAVGSHFTTEIGQYIDLILENGTVIPCILADQKADIHTDDDNIVTIANGCMSEFVIDINFLDYLAKICGDVSRCTEEWRSRVVAVKVYDYNVFDE